MEQQRRAQADLHSPDALEDSSITARLKGKMKSRLATIFCGFIIYHSINFYITHISIVTFISFKIKV